jgi:hypothetical protein
MDHGVLDVLRPSQGIWDRNIFLKSGFWFFRRFDGQCNTYQRVWELGNTGGWMGGWISYGWTFQRESNHHRVWSSYPHLHRLRHDQLFLLGDSEKTKKPSSRCSIESRKEKGFNSNNRQRLMTFIKPFG